MPARFGTAQNVDVITGAVVFPSFRTKGGFNFDGLFIVLLIVDCVGLFIVLMCDVHRLVDCPVADCVDCVDCAHV